MKNNSILFGLLLLAAASCNNASETPSQPTTPEATPAEAAATAPELDSATKAKNWMDYMVPGEMHKTLAMAEGKWNTEMVSYMVEGAPPMTTKGTCEYKMIMGGRYRLMTMHADMMGMPFEGMACAGYDNAKKVFEETWIDNFGTGLMKMTGTYDPATKTYELKGSAIDPETRTETAYREVVRYIDDKNMASEMYTTKLGGTETKAFDMKITR